MVNKISAPMWDQMQVFCENIGDHQIRLVLHFDKILDEKILKEAIRITLENNPITCAKFEEGKKEAFWRFTDINIDKIYSFQECQQPGKLMHEAIIKHIDTFQGPQLYITLIRSKIDALILNCNHAITDAAGVKEFMCELAKNFSCISHNKIVIKQNYTPSRSMKILSKQLEVKEKLAVVKVMLASKRNGPTFSKDVDMVSLVKPDFKLFSFGPVELDKMKEFGKQHDATVNDLLLTAYFFALKKVSKNSSKINRLKYSSDLRKYLEHADCDILSNFSAIHNIDIDNTIDDFTKILKEIAAITKTKKQLKYNLADFPMIAALFKTMSYQKCKSLCYKEFNKIKENKSNAAPALSNVGILEESKLAFNRVMPVRAYMLGGINHPGVMQLMASTYKKHLTLSIGSYYSGKTDIFYSNFMRELKMIIAKEILQNSGLKIE